MKEQNSGACITPEPEVERLRELNAKLLAALEGMLKLSNVLFLLRNMTPEQKQSVLAIRSAIAKLKKEV